MQWRHFVAWQLRCHCIPDHDKFSSLSNKSVVAIFPNICLWRDSYAQNWEVLTLKNCYSIEPPSYVSTANVVASYGPRFLSTVRFVKIWATCENFLGKWFTAPPGKKFPVRLCLLAFCYNPSNLVHWIAQLQGICGDQQLLRVLRGWCIAQYFPFFWNNDCWLMKSKKQRPFWGKYKH